MEFLLSFQQAPDILAAYADPDKGAAISLAWQRYMAALAKAGVLRGGQQLDLRHVSVVRLRDGQREVSAGPAADAPALLGGYVVIDVPTLDDALDWAAQSPSAAAGATEVRAVMPGRRA